MFGMKIKMNEEQIKEEGKLDLKQMYLYIDNLMTKNKLVIGKVNDDGTRMFWGPNSKYDFANFSIVISDLLRTSWFLDNCSLWLWGANEYDPQKWDWEDILTEERQRRGNI